MRKIDWCHPACLWRHWQVWKYHRSIYKWKGYKLREKIRRYEKVRKRYEDTKMVRSYEKGTNLRKRYERLRRCYEISYERAWLQSYQVTITTFCTTTKWLRSIPVKRPPLRRILRNFMLRMRRTYFQTWPLLVTWPLVAPPQILICLYPYTTRVYQQENKIRLACFYLFIYFVIVIFFCVP